MPKHAWQETVDVAGGDEVTAGGSSRHADTAKHVKGKNRKSAALKIILLVCIAAALCFADVYAWEQLTLHEAAEQAASDQVMFKEDPSDVATEPEAVENPIDFEALQDENPDVYAWLQVPGTQVDYPILQHPSDDYYYLDHTRQGAASLEGAIYTELQNSKDFSDPVTVVYGHNILGGLMFATLHDFADPQFFDENQQFFIYLPDRVLTYRIVAASSSDDSHILNTHDFKNEDELEAYHRSMIDSSAWGGNVRDGLYLDSDSKIVQLSTCSNVNDSERYIVTGVLEEERSTC